MPTMKAALLGALLVLGCTSVDPTGPRAQGALARGATACQANAAEVWALDMNFSRDYGLTPAETVQRLANVHMVIKEPEAEALPGDRVAEALAAQFDAIASHPCEGSPFCSRVDARLVVQFSGRDGCRRSFIASRDVLVDVTSSRFGRIGRGFRDVFTLNVKRNCVADDAVGLLMINALEHDVPLEQIEKRELLGPMTWEEFKRAKGPLATALEKEVLPKLGKRTFYYARIGRRHVEGVTGEDWTREGFMLPETCTLLKVGDSDP